MRKTTFTLMASAAVFALAACGDTDVEIYDTATVPGIDTSAGLAVPPMDTLLPTDTLRTDTLTDTTTP